MQGLHVLAAIVRLGRLVGDQARGPQLRDAVREHELDGLILGDGPSGHHALARERRGLLDEALGGSAAARGDHQALAPEPAMGEIHAAALVADEVGGRDPHAGEAVGGMMRRVGMAERGRAHELDARRVHVDEEQAVRARAGAAFDAGLEHEEVGLVGAGHVPLLAVDHVDVPVAPGGGADGFHVGSRVLLADGVALVPAPLQDRQDVALDLLAGAGLEHPALGLGEAPAERIGDSSELLPHHSLLEDGQGEPAPVLRGVHARQSERARQRLVARPDLGGQLARVHLRMDLPRDQLLGHERRDLLLPLPGALGQAVAHDMPSASGNADAGAVK